MLTCFNNSSQLILLSKWRLLLEFIHYEPFLWSIPRIFFCIYPLPFPFRPYIHYFPRRHSLYLTR